MRRSLKWALILAAAIILPGGGWIGYQIYRATNPDLPAPLSRVAQVELLNTADEKVRLGSLERSGVPTIISFWASWCAPCQQEARAFGRLRRDYPAERLNIIYINADENDTPEKIAAFLAKAGNPALPVLRGGKSAFARITGQNMIALPRTYLFDRDGKPTTVFTGYGGDAERELREAVSASAQ